MMMGCIDQGKTEWGEMANVAVANPSHPASLGLEIVLVNRVAVDECITDESPRIRGTLLARKLQLQGCKRSRGQKKQICPLPPLLEFSNHAPVGHPGAGGVEGGRENRSPGRFLFPPNRPPAQPETLQMQGRPAQMRCLFVPWQTPQDDLNLPLPDPETLHPRRGGIS